MALMTNAMKMLGIKHLNHKELNASMSTTRQLLVEANSKLDDLIAAINGENGWFNDPDKEVSDDESSHSS
jgi:hypothetical protein